MINSVIILFYFLKITFFYVVIRSDINQYVTSIAPQKLAVDSPSICSPIIPNSPLSMSIWANECNSGVGPGQIKI
jgi:hypothetical protein